MAARAASSTSAPDSLAMSTLTGQLPDRPRRGRRLARTAGPHPGAPRPAPAVRPGLGAMGFVPLIGVDNVADQPVAYHIVAGQPGEVDVAHAFEDLLHLAQPAQMPCGRSTWVMSPVTTTLEPKPSR